MPQDTNGPCSATGDTPKQNCSSLALWLVILILWLGIQPHAATTLHIATTGKKVYTHMASSFTELRSLTISPMLGQQAQRSHITGYIQIGPLEGAHVREPTLGSMGIRTAPTVLPYLAHSRQELPCLLAAHLIVPHGGCQDTCLPLTRYLYTHISHNQQATAPSPTTCQPLNLPPPPGTSCAPRNKTLLLVDCLSLPSSLSASSARKSTAREHMHKGLLRIMLRISPGPGACSACSKVTQSPA
jgi:hypothetical protein